MAMLSGMETTTPQTDPGPPGVADLAAVAGADRKALRTIVSTELADRSADRSADRAARSAAVRADLKARKYADRSAVRNAKRADRAKVRADRRARRSAWIADQLEYARRNVPSVFSAVVYSMALGVAVSGQVSAAESQKWPMIAGVGIAVFVEGMALSMALTAHELRMRRERALIPRFLTWAFAGIAALINFYAHRDKPLLAVILALSSLASITNWEVRSSAKNRAELRKLGGIPEPGERFGLRRWVRYPRSTFRAWSLDIQTRVTPRAADLLALVEYRATVRSVRKTRSVVRRSARRAVRIAAVRGPAESLPVLKSVADQLLSIEAVRTDPPTVRPPSRTVADRRTTDRPALTDRRTERTTDPVDGPRTTDHGPADPGPSNTDPADPGPSNTDPGPRQAAPRTTVRADRSATVSNIGTRGTDRQRALDAVRAMYADRTERVEWADVRAAAGPEFTSKSGIAWVRDTYNAERSAA